MKSSKVVELALLGSIALSTGCAHRQRDAQGMYRDSNGNYVRSSGYRSGFVGSGISGRGAAPAGTARGGFGGLGHFFGSLG